jgi:hypothetical protein
MEKMDQTHTDCNLTRMGFPGETPDFPGEIYPFLGVFSGCYPSGKIAHHLFSALSQIFI